jgi:hypothetical protein
MMEGDEVPYRVPIESSSAYVATASNALLPQPLPKVSK